MKQIFHTLLLVSLLSCGNTRTTNGSQMEGTTGQPSEMISAEPRAKNDLSKTYHGLTREQREAELRELAEQIGQYEELADWVPFDNPEDVFCLRGNFYGDRDDDLAVLLQHHTVRKWDKEESDRFTDDPNPIRKIRLCIVNRGEHGIRMVGQFGEKNGTSRLLGCGRFRMGGNLQESSCG